ncbi:MAG: SDR family oxidoreductase [Solirubrobacteraceae bacterium]|nr:SDR family oxidoreductase [Solirubrobacteraceae bacterium]
MAGVLDGEVVLITGGNGGIGLGMARGVAEAGARVAIWGRNAEKNAAAVGDLRTRGAEAEAWVCDVGSEDEIVATFAGTLERFGKVDACFANAGVGGNGSAFVDLTLEEWRRVMTVNLDGVMVTLREAAKHMIERGEGGALIPISSSSAYHGAPRNQPYAVSKTALLGLNRTLAVELAKHKIRCNAVCPGWTDTDILGPAREWEKFVNATVGRTPVRRWADPDEFGSVAVYLAQKALTFHTGDELVVDGGYTKF